MKTLMPEEIEEDARRWKDTNSHELLELIS